MTIKSMKKIDHRKATRIAQVMALKAFEHKTAPLEAELATLFKEMYRQTMDALGLTSEYVERLAQHNIITKATYSKVDLKFVINHQDFEPSFELCIGENWSAEYDSENGGWKKHDWKGRTHKEFEEECPRIYAFDDLTLIDPEGFPTFLKLHKSLSLLYKKREALSDTLEANMKDRTAKEVCAEWPEATPFVVKELGLNDVRKPMMKPLENIIGKFLMALPAPEAS